MAVIDAPAESVSSATTSIAVAMSMFPAASASAVVADAAVAAKEMSLLAESGAVVFGPANASAIMGVVVTAAAMMASTGAAPSIFFEAVVSSTTFSDAGEGLRITGAKVSVGVSVNGQVQSVANYHVNAESLARIADGIQFLHDFWDGWATNLNNGGVSFYENFKFNSFCRIGTEYYGCNDSGIFLLGADADAGQPINATLTTGTSDLSTEDYNGAVRKRVPAVYVTAKSPTEMQLTCRVEGQEYTYTFKAARNTMAPSRVDPGKGLVGTLWQFELKNQNGADFEIDSMAVLPQSTSRRI